MRKEYDFSAGIRNPHAAQYKKGSNLIPLDADVAKLFPDAESVNHALRLVSNLMSAMSSASRKPRKRKVG